MKKSHVQKLLKYAVMLHWRLQFITWEGASCFVKMFDTDLTFLSLGRGLATFQYYIKIIPTIFQSIDGEVNSSILMYLKNVLKSLCFTRRFKRINSLLRGTRKILAVLLMQWRKVDYLESFSSTSLHQWWWNTAKRVAPFSTSWRPFAELLAEFSLVSAFCIPFCHFAQIDNCACLSFFPFAFHFQLLESSTLWSTIQWKYFEPRFKLANSPDLLIDHQLSLDY